jgi:NAD(P)-dependent dehydrogenase (short-subunit alcohol dehydrogenase family)
MTRIALVTGASRGIGREIALRLGHQGYRVALTYNARADLALDVVERLRTDGCNALAIRMAIEDRADVRASIAQIHDQWGPVDILVNNAAIAQEKPFEIITDEDWDRMLAVNLRGPFICVQECLPAMIDQEWGRIINITSIGGQWGGLNQVHYAASKAGLINLTRSLAKLYSAKGITTNAVAIGLVQTDMSAAELSTSAGQDKVRAIPRGRIGTVRDIAGTVAFLASDQSDYITGQTINVNGGMYFG